MRSMMLAVLMALLAGIAVAQDSDSAIGNETLTADQAQDTAEPAAVADAKKDDKFEVPPGFQVKKRGDITLYCIKGKSTGTRFQTESCYDRAQLQDYLLAREQNNRDFDQARAVCQTASVCQIQ